MAVNGATGEVSETVDPREVYRGTHLDADLALGCGVALAYFIKAFADMDDVGRSMWMQAHSADYRFELGSLMVSWGSVGNMIFYLSLKSADVTTDDLETVLGTLNASLDNTGFDQEDYRNQYRMRLSEPLIEMQREYEDVGE